MEQLQRKIGERLASIEDINGNLTAAGQIFVESILIWEFGDQLAADVEFAELSNEVTGLILSDSHLRAKLADILGRMRP